MHEKFEKYNLNTPKSFYYTFEQINYDDLSKNLGNSFIVKDPNSSGSERCS